MHTNHRHIIAAILFSTPIFCGGCTTNPTINPATPGMMETSFAPCSAVRIQGIPLGDYLRDRTGLLLDNDGKIIGSATAITTDGFFLTTARFAGVKRIWTRGGRGRQFEAERIWQPEFLAKAVVGHIALYKIHAAELPVFQWAPDDSIFPRMNVIAAGGANLAAAKGLSRGELAEIGSLQILDVVKPTMRGAFAGFDLQCTCPMPDQGGGGPITTVDGQLIGIMTEHDDLKSGDYAWDGLRPDYTWLGKIIARDRVKLNAPKPDGPGF